jgi:hypothetical protein
MNAGPDKSNSPQNEKWDENDPLWRLLESAPRQEPSAWFTTSTMARCRHEVRAEKEGWLSHGVTVQIWRWAFGGAVALSGILALVTHVIVLNNENAQAASNQQNVQDAFQVMASMNTDPDSSSSTSWQDSSN